MKLFQRFLALVCLILLFVFCVSNREPMIVRFLSWESLELPTFLLLIFAFLTGVILALLWQSVRGVSRSSEKKERTSRTFGRKNKEESQAMETPAEKTEGELDSESSEPTTVLKEGEQ